MTESDKMSYFDDCLPGFLEVFTTECQIEEPAYD